MPDTSFDLVLLIGPGVIIALAAVAIYWIRHEANKPKDQ